MKSVKLSWLITIFIIVITNSVSYSQFDTTFYIQKVERWDTNGFLKLKPTEIVAGEMFTIYRNNFLEDTNKTMVLVDQGFDEILNLWYYHYKQYYLNIPVEGAYLTELEIEGFIRYASMKLCPGIFGSTNPEMILPENIAFDSLINNFPNRTLAWADTSWENSLKRDFNSDDATYFPHGELIWTIDNYSSLGYIIDSTRYSLCYKYELYLLEPYEHYTCYINAINGSLFKAIDPNYYNGKAETHHYGEQTIDTKMKGFWNPKYYLIADNNGRKIETRYYADNWSNCSIPDDSDDDWGNSEIDATTAHFYTSKSWDYFKDRHNRDGLKDNGKEVRVKVNYSGSPKYVHDRYFFNMFSSDYIYVGQSDLGNKWNCIDVIGHEFTHGVIHYTAELARSGEGGAIAESICDIFGFMVERYTQNDDDNSIDWTMGEDAQIRRYLDDPTMLSHPAIYKGQYWYNDEVDWYTFVHTNCGPMNKWFYLLSKPGAKTFNNVSVTGIGYNEATKLIYKVINDKYISGGTQYKDIQSATRDIAEILWGECSDEYVQVLEAWKAVGVGTGSPCPQASIRNYSKNTKYKVHFNSQLHELIVFSNQEKIVSLNIFDLNGKIIYSNQNQNIIRLSNISNGMYIVSIQTEHALSYEKFIVSN